MASQSKKLQKLEVELKSMKAILIKYKDYFKVDGFVDTEEQKQLNRMLIVIKEIETKLANIKKAISEKELEVKKQLLLTENELPIDPIDFKDRINDPRITEAILDYDLLLEIESLNPFDLEKKITQKIRDDKDSVQLPFKGNCKLNLIFSWTYTETFRMRKDVDDKFKQKNKAIYKAFFYCEIDEQNEHLSLIPKETETKYTEKDNPIYCINQIDSNADGNVLNLSFDFGRNSNKDNNTFYNNGKLLEYSFSKEFKVRIDALQGNISQSKELIFESENQAVLSSDQRQVCKDWWNSLKDNLKEDIRNRKVKVVIQGFASPPGTKNYNSELGLKRAQNVAKMLTPIIGTDVKGVAVCQFECRTEGEETDDPRRYVKITTIRL